MRCNNQRKHAAVEICHRSKNAPRTTNHVLLQPTGELFTRPNILHGLAFANHGSLFAFDQYFSRERARVVSRGHRKRVRARAQQGEVFTFAKLRQRAVFGKKISGFANGADDIRADHSAIAISQRDNLVISIVKRRTNQIVHRRIDDQKGFSARAFHEFNTRDEYARVAGNESTGLDQNPQAQRLQ